MANSSGSLYSVLLAQLGGVILLGTPHQGSKSQRWGAIVARLAQMVEYGETVLLDEADEKSMKIFDLVFEFMQIMIRTDLARTHAVMCFCENSVTNYLRRFGTAAGLLGNQISAMVCLMQALKDLNAYTDQVVEDTSAILPGVHYVILDSDHLKLNKFASTQDGNYIRVSSNLARIAAQTPGLIQSRQRGQFPESVVA
jgi:hypothetical protein